MDLQLRDKTAVITGGTRGIGLAVAGVLAAEGARVVLVSRTESEAEAAASALASRTGGQAAGIGADTTDDAAVSRLAARVEQLFGGAQILVNCAATPAGQAAVPKPSDAAWETLAAHMNTKVMGYLRCTRALLPAMRRGGWGRIVNISGLGARRTGDVVGTIRNVSVAALTKNLADELRGTGVTANTVHPGLTRTEKVDAMIAARAAREGRTAGQVETDMAAETLLGRLPTADDVAQVVAFLVSPRSAAINGDVIAAGGGTRGSIFY